MDFAGFIFVPKSPRRLDLTAAGEIIPVVREGIRRVGVFADENPARVKELARTFRLDVLQFHGEESPEYCRQFGYPYFKTIRVRRYLRPESLKGYRPECFLLDTFSAAAPGGTGESFDWSIAIEVRERGFPVLLAGGLTPNNVSEAVRRVRPWGVDVCSGVESAPAVKDHHKMRAFVQAARHKTWSPTSINRGGTLHGERSRTIT